MEIIATFSNGVWTRPVPDYSHPHVPGGNGTISAEDRIVFSDRFFGDENTAEYAAWAAEGNAIPVQPKLVQIRWNNGWTIGGAFWLGAGALASWLHHVGSAV